ncbi:hypothetical protein LTR37_020943 [Vermiconidia calcicola]|uniref:Uncharacterized protein n=1 Tax=Vermiconidia calcicola TaxID=1690605 RepID=A0ACC3M9U3_9PEZI|nr:hypothetical protein LTR37_020943 [Vermiconidia calcicola]
MVQLSSSPYQVRRLDPSADTLQFRVDDRTAKEVMGSTLDRLFQAGRLFYADYRDQADLPKTSRYGAACDAYFYIEESSGDFLPLAVRTNVGANLIYTPEDSPNDWLLAKIMLNANDFWFAQWMHLAQTHEVVQIAYMAAIRPLSEQHPVLALLNRLMFEVFAIQPLAQVVLFTPGAVVDQIFPYTGLAAQDYTTNLYKNKGAGRFKSNYFQAELQSRGLIDSNFGPSLKHFPFYEDASVIFSAQKAFMRTFVESYYPSSAAVKADEELQAWVDEAQGPAEAIDFPSISTSSDLLDVLTHFAHLASTAHHTVNTNELLDISSNLPFHPPAQHKELPTTKNVSNVAQYLPPFDKVLTQMSTGALFARPKLVGTDRTLIHQFDDEAMLSRMNAETRAAAAKFKRQMKAFSSKVSSRGFDAGGLSEGMPFVWQASDPNVAPYSITT